MGTDLTLATPTFLGNKNFDSGAWFIHTTPLPDVPGGSDAYGWRVNFPNDPWDGGIEFSEFQEAYDAAVGFTPRRNYRSWDPRHRLFAAAVEPPVHPRIPVRGRDRDHHRPATIG